MGSFWGRDGDGVRQGGMWRYRQDCVLPNVWLVREGHLLGATYPSDDWPKCLKYVVMAAIPPIRPFPKARDRNPMFASTLFARVEGSLGDARYSF